MRRIFNLAMREEMVMRNPCWKVNEASGKERQGPCALAGGIGKAHQATSTARSRRRDHGVSYGDAGRRDIRDDLGPGDLGEGYFILTQKDTKTGEGRHVYFNGEVRQILERLGKVRSISHNFVFTHRGNLSRASRWRLQVLWRKRRSGIFGFMISGIRIRPTHAKRESTRRSS